MNDSTKRPGFVSTTAVQMSPTRALHVNDISADETNEPNAILTITTSDESVQGVAQDALAPHPVFWIACAEPSACVTIRFAPRLPTLTGRGASSSFTTSGTRSTGEWQR